MESRTQRVAAARGDAPLDLLIENVQLVNVYTREIYPADIGISGGYIVFAGPGSWTGPESRARFDADGKFATPGLIDAHMHIESSMMSPAGFAAAVLPHGTTTVVADPHEIGNVMGLRGVRYILDATADLPLRIYVQVPSCVPAVPASGDGGRGLRRGGGRGDVRLGARDRAGGSDGLRRCDPAGRPDARHPRCGARARYRHQRAQPRRERTRSGGVPRRRTDVGSRSAVAGGNPREAARRDGGGGQGLEL